MLYIITWLVIFTLYLVSRLCLGCTFCMAPIFLVEMTYFWIFKICASLVQSGCQISVEFYLNIVFEFIWCSYQFFLKFLVNFVGVPLGG